MRVTPRVLNYGGKFLRQRVVDTSTFGARLQEPRPGCDHCQQLVIGATGGQVLKERIEDALRQLLASIRRDLFQ